VTAQPIRIGVIGGSGLYGMAELTAIEERAVETPFGPPSDALTIGMLGGERVAFLPRHGRGHRFAPTDVPYRANIWAMKALGVQFLIAVSAVGSLREGLAPLDLVVPDQLVDRTVARPRTFFDAEAGMVAHVSLAEPFCAATRAALLEAARTPEVGARVHDGGAYICIEGPQFSTKGESRLFRNWGLDVIGMTGFPEARLAREAELCYAMLAMVTDYDVWHEEEEPVTVQVVIERLHRNAAAAQAVVRALVPKLAMLPVCEADGEALASAIITDPTRIPAGTKERLGMLLGRHLPGYRK
jgi:5'-methylthioadenosine phosphorylase